MLRAIVVDDESGAREILCGMLEQFVSDVEVVAQADNVQGALKVIESNKPDIVFLDIQMPTGSGFDVLDQLNERTFDIIFCTAFDQYALQAIKFTALDYLLKPITPNDLKAAVDKVRERSVTGNDAQLQLLQQNLKDLSSRHNKIALSAAEGISIVELNEIVHCEGENNYTTFHLVDGAKLVVSKTLKEYEKLLANNGFMRIFQSHLVNVDHIKRYLQGRGGQVEMSNGDTLPVSREKKQELLDLLKNLMP